MKVTCAWWQCTAAEKIEWTEVEIFPFDNYQRDKYMGIYGWHQLGGVENGNK